MATKTKSKKQVGYLLSSGSPLTSTQKLKLKRELHSGSVKVKSSMKKSAGKKMMKKAAKKMVKGTVKKVVKKTFEKARKDHFGL